MERGGVEVDSTVWKISPLNDILQISMNSTERIKQLDTEEQFFPMWFDIDYYH